MLLEDVKKIEELEVYQGAFKVGVLRRTPQGSELEFDKGFIESAGSKGISFHLKKREEPYRFQGDSIPPFFAGLLPEGLRLKTLTKRIKTSEDDLYSILAAVGSHCVGDVYVLNGEEVKENNGKDALVDLNNVNFYEVFEQNLVDEKFSAQDESIPGVQEKISASMISFPLRLSKKNKSYILKLNPKDKQYLVHNEFLALSLAKKSGLEVNKAVLVKDKSSQEGLLVERFDRFLDKSGEVKMLHQEDACQFLNRYPADKYRLSFKEVLEGVQTYASAPKIEILKALKLYAFSYLIGNGDLHAKNISLQVLEESKKVVLTPAYDLISTYIYKDHKMALKINGRNDNVKRKDFIDLGAFFSIPEKAISLMLDRLISAVQKHHEIIFDCMDAKQKTFWMKMFKKRTEDLSVE